MNLHRICKGSQEQGEIQGGIIMIVQHNITSMNANRQLGIVGKNLGKATEKLASGYKINRAADDAAGLAISEKMRTQVRGLTRASSNAQDGISLIQTAEGALQEQHSILQRARELTVQASNTAVLQNSDANTDIAKIQAELTELKSEYDRISSQTEFNKKKLLDGTYTSQYLQVGANAEQGYTVTISKQSWAGITLDKSGSTNSKKLSDLDKKIEDVSVLRSKLGAYQNKLEHTVAVDDNTAENLSSAESRIRDTDMADEMTRYSKESILQQAATSMLAQANQSNQGVLSLLG
jgi:flagellin